MRRKVRDALNNYFGPSAKPRDAWDRLFRNYVKMTAFFKYGKTILSPVTHFRNFVGNVFFMVNNAYNPFLVHSVPAGSEISKKFFSSYVFCKG